MSSAPVGLLVAACLTLAAAGPAPAGPPPARRPPEEKAATRTDRYGDPLPEGAVARLGTVRLRPAEPRESG